MATKYPNNYKDKQFRLLPSLLAMDGEPHQHAGEVITVLERASKNTYQVSTEAGGVIVVREEDWGPVHAPEASVAAALAEQLQTINLYTDPTLNKVVMVDLDLIDDSPFQPRTHYPEAFIEGLADSMKVVGMLQAMLIRPKADGRYENVFGHCRKRGARKGGLTQGPAIIRELSDAESAQLQAVENLQRKDLDAFDEALSFQAYIHAHKCTKEEFCKRTGLSRTQVYNRLKLATLHADGQKALRDGKIRAEVATLIARVPSEKHQAQALKMILDNTYEHTGELMTVRKARDMLAEKFTLALKGVIWALDDATLVPAAGACTVCPKRSGVDPVVYVDLLGDTQRRYQPGPTGENVCTDPMCFDEKKTAQLKANQAELEAKGKVVISGNKARQAVGAHGDIKGGYIALKDVKEAIKKAAGKGQKAPVINTVTIQNPRDGKTIEVVKADDLKAAGVKVAEPKQSGHASYGSEAWKAQQAQEEAKREKSRAKAKAETDFNLALLAKVREQTAKVTRSTFDLQLIAQLAIAGVQHHDTGVLELTYGVDDIKKLRKLVGSWSAEKLGQFILDCALVHNVHCREWNPTVPHPLLAAAKHYGVDADALRKDLAASSPVEPKAKATKKAKAATVPTEDEEEEAA